MQKLTKNEKNTLIILGAADEIAEGAKESTLQVLADLVFDDVDRNENGYGVEAIRTIVKDAITDRLYQLSGIEEE